MKNKAQQKQQGFEFKSKKASEGIELLVLDHAIQLGLVLGLLFALERAVANVFIISFFGFLFLLFFCLWMRSKRENNPSLEMKFEGNIDRLTVEMVGKVGLILNNQVGNYYIYSSRARIMPNVKYVVRDHGEFCVVIAPGGRFCNIKNCLDLKPVDNMEEAQSKEEIHTL